MSLRSYGFFKANHIFLLAHTLVRSFTHSLTNPNCAHKIWNYYPINLLTNHWIWWIFETHLWKQVINSNLNAHMRIISYRYEYIYFPPNDTYFCSAKKGKRIYFKWGFFLSQSCQFACVVLVKNDLKKKLFFHWNLWKQEWNYRFSHIKSKRS